MLLCDDHQNCLPTRPTDTAQLWSFNVTKQWHNSSAAESPDWRKCFPGYCRMEMFRDVCVKVSLHVSPSLSLTLNRMWFEDWNYVPLILGRWSRVIPPAYHSWNMRIIHSGKKSHYLWQIFFLHNCRSLPFGRDIRWKMPESLVSGYLQEKSGRNLFFACSPKA